MSEKQSLRMKKYLVLKVPESCTEELAKVAGEATCAGVSFDKLVDGRVADQITLNVVKDAFVLLPERDPAALAALSVYAEFCEPELSDKIRLWLCNIKDCGMNLLCQECGARVCTQGARNLPSTVFRQVPSAAEADGGLGEGGEDGA